MATTAFLALPVVLASRAKVPRHGDLRARDAAQATWTRMVQSHGLPWRTGAALDFPPLSFLPGARPAHEARCLAEENVDMSAPVSASTAAMETVFSPGIT